MKTSGGVVPLLQVILVVQLGLLVGIVHADCGGSLWFNLENYNCDLDSDVNYNVRDILFRAMESAVQDVTRRTDIVLESDRLAFGRTAERGREIGYPTSDELASATQEQLDSDTGVEVAAARDDGRQRRQQEQRNRDLQEWCYPGIPYPYCAWCGSPCYRRQLLREAMEETAVRTGRSLDDVKTQVCNKIQQTINDASGDRFPKCLKDAKVANCDFTAPTSQESAEINRKDDTVVEAGDGGDASSGDSSSSTSGAPTASAAFRVLSLVFTTAVVSIIGTLGFY